MSGWLILLVGIIYFLIGIDFLFDKNYPMSIVFIAYGVANFGFYFVR